MASTTPNKHDHRGESTLSAKAIHRAAQSVFSVFIAIFALYQVTGWLFLKDEVAVPASSAGLARYDPRYSALDHLVLVAGHAVYTHSDYSPATAERDESWHLQSFQKGEGGVYIAHIRKGVELAGKVTASSLYVPYLMQHSCILGRDRCVAFLSWDSVSVCLPRRVSSFRIEWWSMFLNLFIFSVCASWVL